MTSEDARRYDAFIEELSSMLDLDAGLAETMQPHLYRDLIVDLAGQLDVDAGLTALPLTTAVAEPHREKPGVPAFFLCYRREYAGYAAALSATLTNRYGPHRVFLDTTSLQLAQSWREQVAAKLDRSTHVLALVGPQWMDGVDPDGRQDGQLDPVVFELTGAFERNLTVVPVLLDGQRLPAAHILPAGLGPFAELNAAHIRSESVNDDIARLVDRLPLPVHIPTNTRRFGWIIGAVAVVLVVVLAALPLFAPSTPESLPATPVPMPVVTEITDPCSFISTEDLAEFGQARLTPEYGEFQGCTATILAGGEAPVEVRVDLDVPQPSDQPFPGVVDTRGDLVIAREPCAEECRTTLQMALGPRVVLQVRYGDVGLRQRVAGRVTETATRVLEDGPLRERPPFPERSLSRSSACDLLTEDDLHSRVNDLNGPEPTAGFGGWSCAWGNPAPPTDTVIGIGYYRVVPNEITDEGREMIAAREVYVSPRTESDGRSACAIDTPAVGFTSRTGDPRVEVVQLLVRGAESRSVEQMCSYARALAEVVVPRLPR